MFMTKLAQFLRFVWSLLSLFALGCIKQQRGLGAKHRLYMLQLYIDIFTATYGRLWTHKNTQEKCASACAHARTHRHTTFSQHSPVYVVQQRMWLLSWEREGDCTLSIGAGILQHRYTKVTKMTTFCHPAAWKQTPAGGSWPHRERKTVCAGTTARWSECP